jgi:arylsulfatase A-like enzyme
LPFIRKITDGNGFDEIYDKLSLSDQGPIDQVWEWIEEKRERPFFAFVRLNGAHWPYNATPEEMADLDACDGQDHAFNKSDWRQMGFMPPADRGEGVRLVNKEKYFEFFFNTDIPAATRRHIIAHYDAEIRQTDAVIGSLIDRMQEANLLDQTIVVITADHGESFGEHGYLQHGPKVDEPVVRVPLIIRLPKEHPFADPGRAVEDQVSTTDILPTLLTAVGVKVPDAVDGENLLPAMKGKSLGKRWAYAESGKDFVGASPEVFVEGIKGKQRMIRYDGWKLVYIPKPDMAVYQLFNLRDDPGENRDVAREFPERVKELRAILESVLKSDEDDGSRERELTDAEKEQLRQLGYM